MKHNNIQQRTSVQIAVLFLTLSGAGQAMADSPLSLTVSETLTYDTNLLRDDRNKQSDVISNTGVQIAFDKDYGRQNYHASVQGIVQRYKKLNQYDNDGYDVSLGMSTEIAARGYLSIDHSRSQTLQDFGQQGLVRIKETISSNNTLINARYGLSGWWAFTGAFNFDDVSYDINKSQDITSSGARLGVRHNFSDLLYVDVGLKKSKSDLPRNKVINTSVSEDDPDFGFPHRGENVKRTDIDVLMGWTVTGYSQIDGRIGWTDEKHKPDIYRSFKGFTWRAKWAYTPRGKLVYSLALDRDTNNAGGNTSYQFIANTPFLGSTNEQRLTTSLSSSVRWLATPKFSTSLAWNYRALKESQGSVVTSALDVTSTGHYQSLTFGMRYLMTRALTFNCSLNMYDRSATLFSSAYSGDSATCTAAFAIN
jgi:hypothetical protein